MIIVHRLLLRKLRLHILRVCWGRLEAYSWVQFRRYHLRYGQWWFCCTQASQPLSTGLAFEILHNMYSCFSFRSQRRFRPWSSCRDLCSPVSLKANLRLVGFFSQPTKNHLGIPWYPHQSQAWRTQLHIYVFYSVCLVHVPRLSNLYPHSFRSLFYLLPWKGCVELSSHEFIIKIEGKSTTGKRLWNS